MASKEERGNFGKSRTGRTIKRKITITKRPVGKRKVTYKFKTRSGKSSSKTFKSKKEAVAALAKANVAEARTPTRRVKPRRVVQNGAIFEVGKTGFRRVGFTREEASRIARIKSGTAVAKDIVPRLRASQTQAERGRQILTRTRKAQIGKEKKRRIESQAAIMRRAGQAKKLTPKELAKSKADLSNVKQKTSIVPATKLEKAQLKLLSVKQSREKAIRKKAALAPLFGTLGVPLGFVSGIAETTFSVLKPKQTTSDLKQFAKTFFKKPIQTTVGVGRGVSQSFITDPAVFVGEFYAYGKITNKAISVTRRSALGRVIQKELFLLQQPKELQKSMRTILNAAEAQRKLNPVPKTDIKKISFYDVKELNKVEAKALAKALKQTDSVVFGSKAARVLSKGKTKIPKDVDLATKDTAKFNKAFLANLPKNVRKNYVVKTEKILRGKEAILDVKPLGRLIPERSILTRTGYLPVSGYVRKIELGKGSILPKKAITGAFEVRTAPILKVSGIKLVGFGEQTLRKALGTLQVLVEKNARRAKDPSALLEALEIQLKAVKKSKRLNKASIERKLTDAIKLLNQNNSKNY